MTIDRLIIKLSIIISCALVLPYVSSSIAFLAVSISGLIGIAIGWQHYRLHLRRVEAEVTREEIAAKFQAISSQQGTLALHDGELSFWTRESAVKLDDAQAPTIAAPVENAIGRISESLCLVLIGPQGTGKTTLLQHLIDSRKDGESIIIDPHGYHGKYPGHARIVGEGRDYQDIDQAMIDIMDELQNRYKIYHDQEYPMLYIYIDELTLLNQHCGAMKDFMKIMLTESRKVGIRLTACLHSRRVKFLGLERAGDLADGIDFLNLKNENGRRWAELETDAGNIELALPGPYKKPVTPSRRHAVTPEKQPETPGFGRCDKRDNRDMRDKRDAIPLGYNADGGHYAYQHEPVFDEQIETDVTEQDIIDAYRNLRSIGKKISLKKIAEMVFNGGRNSRRNKIIRTVLSKHGARI